MESGIIPVSEEDKRTLIAEMKLFCASYYWVLCDFFGNVPIVVTGLMSRKVFYLNSVQGKQVFEFIVDEIQQSIRR